MVFNSIRGSVLHVRPLQWGHGAKRVQAPNYEGTFPCSRPHHGTHGFWNASGKILKLPDAQLVTSYVDGAVISTILHRACQLSGQHVLCRHKNNTFNITSLNITRHTWAALHRQMLIHLIHNLVGYLILLFSVEILGSQILRTWPLIHPHQGINY